MNPKYYRCITKNNGLVGFTTNKIYKIKDPSHLERDFNFIDDKGLPNGCGGHNYKHFKSVTELEWNLQEGIITKVGKEDYSYLIKLLKKLHIT